MTKTLLLTLLLTTPAFAAERLTNDDIIRLTKAKLSQEVIITAITNSEPAFDTSTQALIDLRAAGVANEVITAMLARTTGTTGGTSDPTIVRLEFPSVHHRMSKVGGYIGTLRLYDDRLVFVPRREEWQQYALDLPWRTVKALCFEEGPIFGDLFLTVEGRDDPVRLSTDSDKIQGMRTAAATLTKQSISECE